MTQILTSLYSISTVFIPSPWQYRIVLYRYFAKIPLHLNVTLFTHRDMQRCIEKYAAYINRYIKL